MGACGQESGFRSGSARSQKSDDARPTPETAQKSETAPLGVSLPTSEPGPVGDGYTVASAPTTPPELVAPHVPSPPLSPAPSAPGPAVIPAEVPGFSLATACKAENQCCHMFKTQKQIFAATKDSSYLSSMAINLGLLEGSKTVVDGTAECYELAENLPVAPSSTLCGFDHAGKTGFKVIFHDGTSLTTESYGGTAGTLAPSDSVIDVLEIYRANSKKKPIRFCAKRL